MALQALSLMRKFFLRWNDLEGSAGHDLRSLQEKRRRVVQFTNTLAVDASVIADTVLLCT